MKNVVLVIIVVMLTTTVGYGSTRLLYTFDSYYTDGSGNHVFPDFSGNGFDGMTNVPFPPNYWRIEERDSTGNPGIIGNNSVFSNGSIRLVMPQASPLSNIYDGTSDAWTVEAYARTANNMTTGVSERFTILGFGGGIYANEQIQTIKVGWIGTDTSGGRGTVEFNDGTTTTTLIDTANSYGNAILRHVAASYDGADLKLFVNGVEKASATIGSVDMLGLRRARLMHDDNTQYYGNLDDFRFSDTALPANELGYGKVLPEPATLGLILIGGIAAIRRRR